MDAKKILKSVGLEPDEVMFSMNNEELMDNLLKFIDKWELQINIRKISKADWRILLSGYAGSLIYYHPENDHQERGTFLRNEEILKRYGLTNEDVKRLDFC